jgi:tRNA(fMet)-specific endonuclease VapC
MSLEKLGIDSSAAVDYFDPRIDGPLPLEEALSLFLPLPVLGELKFGVLNAAPQRRAEAAQKLNDLVERCNLLAADRESADFYARIRMGTRFPPNMSRRREIHLLNDLWIAALCVQHKLPLLSNDRDFDGIEGLEVIHW